MPTIDEVSNRANVSASTVSRVLNGTVPVAEATRQRVLDAIDELNDRPNAFARSLATNRSGGVGVSVYDLASPFYGAILTEVLLRLARDHPTLPPLYVTENGAAYPDVLEDSAVHDHDRIRYLDGHIDAVAAAVAGGAPVHGYFAWSLMDNFEWARGYDERFGLVYVDYATQQRIAKDSARWYRARIARADAEEDAGVPSS